MIVSEERKEVEIRSHIIPRKASDKIIGVLVFICLLMLWWPGWLIAGAPRAILFGGFSLAFWWATFWWTVLVLILAVAAFKLWR